MITHCVFKGSQVEFLSYDVFLSLKVALILANSAGHDEMQQYVAFHVGLHCLTKKPVSGFPVYKSLICYPKKAVWAQKTQPKVCQFELFIKYI